MATNAAAATAATTAATAATTLMVAAVVLLALPVSTTAQSPTLAPGPSEPSVMAPGPSTLAPGPSLDCFTILLNMSDCLSFVEPGSNLTKPESPCCPELAGLVESSPICLCQLLGDPEKAGITIDVNKALKLPSACGLSTPPVNLCSLIGVPVSLPPASVPTASETAGSPEALASSPGGAKDGNGGRSIEASLMCFLAGLATMISISFF